MTTINTIKNFVSENKIGKGANKQSCANCLTIKYPAHKVEQCKKEISILFDRFSLVNSNGETIVHKFFIGKVGVIQIYLA